MRKSRKLLTAILIVLICLLVGFLPAYGQSIFDSTIDSITVAYGVVSESDTLFYNETIMMGTGITSIGGYPYKDLTSYYYLKSIGENELAEYMLSHIAKPIYFKLVGKNPN